VEAETSKNDWPIIGPILAGSLTIQLLLILYLRGEFYTDELHPGQTRRRFYSADAGRTRLSISSTDFTKLVQPSWLSA